MTGRQFLRRGTYYSRMRSIGSITAAERPLTGRKSLLVDGNNVLYHFYDPLSTVEHNGMQSGAVDGMIRLLQRMDKEHEPQHISVVFDSKQRLTTRRILQPSYKRDRALTPRSLVLQFAYAKEVLETAKVNCIQCPGLEADDIIASYSAQYTAAGFDVLLISNDNDFLQLVQGGDSANVSATAPVVELYQPSKRRYVRERNIRARFGLHPKLLPDFHALCGHQWKKLSRVDNLADEVAVQLLTQYGGLYPLLRHLDELDDSILCNTLKRCITSIESSYRMVKLVDSVALPVAIEELHQPQFN
ncbi:unnamed protein product [Peronospora destructor]|uniref:5'-3' exonuclease domain-containing protein n=1 Tax=Peronospora destructor TaxID=86335 RepID=A0AAV0TQB3_9STRA|nr:unnamed protein product [Peronospora destructor]CAI5725646.1 unnamed protein product [Peronospora destructor]